MVIAKISGALPGRSKDVWALASDEFIIGRNPPANLVVDAPRVSRQHACIARTSKGYFLSDLESTNGTFLNGEPLGSLPRRLTGGDEIVIAGVLQLQFEDPDETLQGPVIGRFEGIWIDQASRDVYVDGRKLEPPLSAAQFTLLAALYRREGAILSREAIVAVVWPDSDPAGVSREALNGLIKRLRRRLRENQASRDYLDVLRGHGLRLLKPN
jgi:DNA-binding winged helix-turn-helix (wHTH) protein